LLLFPPLSLVFSSIPPPPPALPPFSLHDALPISGRLHAVVPGGGWRLRDAALRRRALHRHDRGLHRAAVLAPLRLADGQRHVVRSEEHTSELQSLTNLVCRLLLEKKKKIISRPHY